ncbi:hypothetical protein E4T50_13467 [Aureobasidium sp. EXF-12298]|nr:hypothetical protein E4T50_13467 [Aureobasidium sp. EXF-12298]KAI4753788.1 hypothetical protein E4T51_13089 [Aureobasidium sp. EXF-12344]KAI4770951.1 hypothetical protein E4T52_14053 [Aureobasidium sp. EXF-3400]
MSAEDLGTRELGQVRSQRLDELLTTLRLLHDPSSNSKLGIPALDKLLATHTTRFDPTNLSGIPAPPIIEITSPAPKSGKTEFLYWVIANLVLGGGGLDQPEGVTADHADDSVGDGTGTTSGHTEDNMMQPTEDQSTLDGCAAVQTIATARQTTEQPDQPHNNSTPQTNQFKQSNQTTPKAVVLLSTSPINIPRLSQILLHHLLTLRPTLSPTEAQPLIITALSHIHIYQLTSISSLLATISSLPSYFFSTSNTSKDRRLGGIFISTPSAYFWEDKVQVVTSAATSASAASKTGKFAALAMVLRRVGAVLQTPVFYTTSHLSASSASSTDPVTWALPPALASPFSTLPTLRLIISRGAIKGFSKEVDAETAFRQKEARATATRNSNFRVRVNQWGNELQGNTGFEVRIDASGVRIL